MFRTYVVVLANLVGNLILSLTPFQSAPNEHCRLVQRVVTLGIQIDKHGFATVELGIDNVTVRLWFSGGVQVILSLV